MTPASISPERKLTSAPVKPAPGSEAELPPMGQGTLATLHRPISFLLFRLYALNGPQPFELGVLAGVLVLQLLTAAFPPLFDSIVIFKSDQDNPIRWFFPVQSRRLTEASGYIDAAVFFNELLCFRQKLIL